jgi:polysaccharide deacetylase 2 family uncharacterized protein YibQ
LRRPFSARFITARIVYPILLGIILLSAAQLPSNTVSVIAHLGVVHEPHPTTRSITTMAPTNSTIIFANVDAKSAPPNLNPNHPVFCFWGMSGPKMPVITENLIKEAPPFKAQPSKTPLAQTVPDEASKHPQVAIIIDDVGYTAPETEELMKLPVSLTWAILPDAPYVRGYLDLAREKGVEVMLHLPLESIDEKINPGPGVIKGSWDENRVIRQLDHDLAAVPGVVGVNNHMGSLGTQDPRLMDLIMKTLHQKKLFFVDSRTTAKTVAEESAAKYGEPFARRRVFIDNDPEIERKKAAIRSLIALARKEGSAIGIAHVRKGNAAAILAMLPEITRAGVEIVPVSQLAR